MAANRPRFIPNYESYWRVRPAHPLLACLACGLTIIDDVGVIELHNEFHNWMDSRRAGRELFTQLVDFSGAHYDELTPYELAVIGVAAGAVDRITGACPATGDAGGAATVGGT